MAKSPRWIPQAQLPEWIPTPRAWVNAVALIMLMIAWQYAMPLATAKAVSLICTRMSACG